jgi:hypothetical protein
MSIRITSVVIAVALLLVASAFGVFVISMVGRHVRTMRVRARIILGTVVGTLVVGVSSCVHHISSPRVVGRAVAPDGTEMCIVQECNWSPEPFTTSFVYRRPGGTWGRFYFDHQDIYWASSRVSLDTNAGVSVFYRGASRTITFAWATETYTMHRWSRTITGAQWQLPAGWTPHMSVH